MNFKTFIIGLLILILAPILVIGIFATYAHLSNASPQSGLLHCHVESPVVFKGDETTYTVSFLGEQAPRPANQSPPPVDMIFVVDISSSMCNSLPEMTQAARTIAYELTDETVNDTRFAMTWFHEMSEIGTSWTGDPNLLYSGLNNLICTGNTNGATSFPPIKQLLAQARSNSTKVIVFYTDGLIFPDTDRAEQIVQQANTLRNQGVKIFSISPPQSNDHSVMSFITGSPTHVLQPTNLQDLVRQFRFVADTVTGVYGNNAQIIHRFDWRNFKVPVEKSPWYIDDNTGYLQQAISYLPYKSVDYHHTLIPNTTGLWSGVALAPLEISFMTTQNQLETLKCGQNPALLVLSWWLIFLAFLPALLWLLSYLTRRISTKAIPEYIPPPIRSLAPPSPLPLPLITKVARKTVVPTLFIGLGGSGRQALIATQEQLRAAHLENETSPYRFLWLDLDSSETAKKVPFQSWEAIPVREVAAPKEVCQTTQYMPSANQELPAHLTWFNPRDYLDASREELDLAKGSNGQRALARLALFQWLATGQLLTLLKEEYQALLDFASVDDNRQIILLANRTTGVGSGWFLDIARLLRRIARQGQPNAQAFVPEIVGILSSAPYYEHNPQQQHNWQALDQEIKTAQMTGAFPQHITYQPEPELLDQTDNESPFNYLFAVQGLEQMSAAIQSAAFSAVLVERYPRWTLLNEPLHQGQSLFAQTKGIHVMPDLDYQLVKREVLLRLLSPEILLDLELDAAKQKMVIKPVSDSQAEKLLIKWNANEQPKGSPWQLLLNSVVGLAGDSQFFSVMNEKGHPDLVWFQQAFIASLTRQLRCREQIKEEEQNHRKRLWMPGEAVVALRLFADRLEQKIKPQAPVGELADILQQMIDLSQSAALQLENWLMDFAPRCKEIGEEQRDFKAQRNQFRNRADQEFLDESVDDQRITQWANLALQQWVGSVDTISALSERLFFSARFDKNDVVIVLSVYVEEKHEYSLTQTKYAFDKFNEYADTATQQVPILKVEEALAHIETQRQKQQLAQKLTNTRRDAKQVILVTPNVTNNTEMTQELESFQQSIKVPPEQEKVTQYCYGDDHSAIRRVALWQEVPLPAVAGRLPFVQAAEQAAQQMRQRAITHFEMEIPLFPPALRIALSQPQAFHSFSLAYQAGQITKNDDMIDERGIAQWVFGEQKIFLTFGEANSLADAAANYVSLIENPPTTFTQKTPGDFSELEAWQNTGGPPQDDAFVLIAIKVHKQVG